MPRFRPHSPVLAVLALATPAAAQCWEPTFGGEPGAYETRALAVHDDGSGLALYAGGGFSSAGGVPASQIARWDGTSWSDVGGGIHGLHLHGLAVFDDGNGAGPQLYAAGNISSAGGVAVNNIARWDGTAWSPLGSGTNDEILCLLVHDDGSGSALYAGGHFTTAGGVAASRIAKWDGTDWSPVGGGANSVVRALVAHDEGSGPQLYAAGSFTQAGGISANRVARWDGIGWSALGTGVGNNQVNAMAVHDDGTGPALYLGGGFTLAGGVSVNHLARWDGTSWSALGAGTTDDVEALIEYDDGSGTALYMGGSRNTQPGDYVNKWDGTGWSLIGDFNSPVYAFAVHDDGSGSGPLLFAGGRYSEVVGNEGMAASGMAAWDGNEWSTLGDGLNGTVEALALYDDGSGAGTQLYAGGDLFYVGSTPSSLGKWNGTSLSAVGSTEGFLRELCVYDDGGDEKLFVASWPFMHSWDGTTWSSLPSIPHPGLPQGYVQAMLVHDDGSGPALYAGGAFASSQGLNDIARWDGTGWSSVGNGAHYTTPVTCLAEYDDGGGLELYMGGSFTVVGGVAADRIAKWDGTSWSALGSGLGSAPNALIVHDDGSGSALYAGGDFTTAGGSPASYIARWNGTTWSTLGSGLNGPVESLVVYEDALYAGGTFDLAGGVTVSNIARWDGTAWSALEGGGVLGTVTDMISYDEPGSIGPALIVAGSFKVSPAADSFLAWWGPCALTTYCTAGTSASGCQAMLSATGAASASSSSGFVLSAAGVEGGKDGLYFFGTNGRQANPWGNGTSFQCVVPPVVRAPIMTGIGTVAACDGSFALDLNALWCPSCPKPAKNPGSGELVQAQLWYRDPQSTSNQSTSLSDAIEFSVAP